MTGGAVDDPVDLPRRHSHGGAARGSAQSPSVASRASRSAWASIRSDEYRTKCHASPARTSSRLRSRPSTVTRATVTTVLIHIGRSNSDVATERKLRGQALRGLTERLSALGAIDTIEPDTFSSTVVQDRKGVAIRYADHLARERGGWSVGGDANGRK